MSKLPFTFTKRNFLFLLICLGGITILVLASILPLLSKSHELSMQIPEIEAKLKTQKEMVSVLAALDLKSSRLEKIKGLPEVTPESLPITESNRVITEVTDLTHHLQLSDLDISALMPKSCINLHNISFSASVKGDISHIHSFIFSLLQLPYIDKIKQFELETDGNVLILKLIFTVGLS